MRLGDACELIGVGHGRRVVDDVDRRSLSEGVSRLTESSRDGGQQVSVTARVWFVDPS